MLHIFSLSVLALVALVACDPANYSSVPKSTDASRAKKNPAGSGGASGASGGSGSSSSQDQNGNDSSVSSADPSVVHDGVKVGGPAGSLAQVYKYGPRSTPNDVLFVFDNSVSMGAYLTNVKAGFEKLAGAEWFGDSRIAVMTTMAGNRNDLTATHPGIIGYNGIRFEPGFLSFVSSAAFEKYKAAGGKVAAYPEPLCDEEWFKPTAVNANNNRCLSVALQNPFHGVDCEAGMTALSQLHDKKGKVFRDGALAQIVFISDAQDPGCTNFELAQIRPSAEALKNKVMSNNKISGVKFHGVVTVEGGSETSETKNNKTFGFPYNALINASGGILIDITKSMDYSDFAKSVAKSSLPEPLFPLSKKASRVFGVKLNGQMLGAERFELSPDGLSVRVNGLSPAAEVEIAIIYDL